MSSKRTSHFKLLTQTELELMNILWKIGEGNVNDVLLETLRPLAYTSASTILRILEQKEIVGSRKEGRGHIYFPKVAKEKYEEVSVQNLVTKVFEGEASSLVRRLIETNALNEKEILELKNLLDGKIKT